MVTRLFSASSEYTDNLLQACFWDELTHVQDAVLWLDQVSRDTNGAENEKLSFTRFA
jgi:hypothetical protein